MGELLVLLAIGVFLWLLNVVLPVWRQRQQRDAARGVGPPVSPDVPRPRSLQPVRAVPRPGFPVPVVEPLVATRQRVPVRPGGLRDIRRGIVLMTLLGPCRALEPPDPAP
jgi:hypothetical protein